MLVLGGDDLTSGVEGIPALVAFALLNMAAFVRSRARPELLAPAAV